MKVILLEKVRNLGDLGTITDVRRGYAVNYLFPQGKAKVANDANLKEFEIRRAELEKKAAENLTQAESRAEKLRELLVTVKALSSDEGKLYGSVGPQDIAKAINEAGVEVLKREINLPEGPIHSIGEYTVLVQVHSDVAAEVKVTVVPAK